MERLELKLGYIADAIIDVKKERFNERFATIEEIFIIRDLMKLRFKRKNQQLLTTDYFFDGYFRVDNDVVTKTNDESSLKPYIGDQKIIDLIYDNDFIYHCLLEILNNKINNSMEHTCFNCKRVCGNRMFSSPSYLITPNECERWKHNFDYDCKEKLKPEERQFVKEFITKKK